MPENHSFVFIDRYSGRHSYAHIPYQANVVSDDYVFLVSSRANRINDNAITPLPFK